MATITLEYDARNTTFKKLIDVFVSVGARVVQSQPDTKHSGIEEALEDIEQGRVTEHASVRDYFAKKGIG